MRWHLLLLFLIPFASARAPEAEDMHTSLDRFVERELAREPREDGNRLVDLNAEAGTSYDGGIAYAVVVDRRITCRYASVSAVLAKEGGILRVVAAVKTHRNLRKIYEELRLLRLKLAIHVPVIPDFETQAEIQVRDGPGERGVLSWRQLGTEGHLEYSRGAVMVQGDNAYCRVRVVGLHVIKPEHRIPWIGRLQADSFAREHYSNYIEALETVLAAPLP